MTTTVNNSKTPANANGVGLRTSEATFAAVTGYAARREVNYAEAEKVLAVTEIFGMRLVAHADMPPDECHLVQNGRCVGKIIMRHSR